MENIEKIRDVEKQIIKELDKVKDSTSLEKLRIKYFSKKGKINELQNMLKEIEISKRKEFGKVLNEVKTNLNDKFDNIKKDFEEIENNKKLEEDYLDVTLPASIIPNGYQHPLSKIIEEIEELFISLGFDIVDGQEMEEDKYNFEYLNIPKGHPARDTQDSLYINPEWLLRTHTSPIQARIMQSNDLKEPIKLICPGKTYRKDNDDATHSHQFMQIEGLVVGENISMTDLKGILDLFLKRLFGAEREIRLRPSYFPFTEPSIEVDISCFKCNGEGCNICKKTGWIEVLGAGMVHPNVLEMSGYDKNKYTGFAFGVGIERLAMLKYEISDIRLFYNNDIRFIKQFDNIGGEYK